MTRGRWLTLARIAFVVAAIGFGWWSIRGQWQAVLAAMARVGPWAWLASSLLVLVGLGLTGLIWTTILRSYGHAAALRPALSVFFVGQLGKYIPGSVWALGAQAQMAGRFAIPARVTVAAGLVFLEWNVASAVAIGFAADLLGFVDLRLPPVVDAVAILAGLVGLTPLVVNRLGTWMAGTGARLSLGRADVVRILPLMVSTWFLYGLAMRLLDPGDGAGTGLGLGTAVGAFTIAYALGVVIILAPAGLGAREATLALLLTPSVGLASATAIALCTRVVHTLSDFTIAGAAWLVGRRAEGAPAGSGRRCPTAGTESARDVAGRRPRRRVRRARM